VLGASGVLGAELLGVALVVLVADRCGDGSSALQAVSSSARVRVLTAAALMPFDGSPAAVVRVR
jgi:hypothetical protein